VPRVPTFVIGHPEAELAFQAIAERFSIERAGSFEPAGKVLKAAERIPRPLPSEPFVVLNGSGNRHHETVLLVESFLERERAERVTYLQIDAHPDKALGYRGDLAKDNPAIDRLVYGPELLGFYAELFGEPVRHFDHTWFRAISRGQGTPPHCDLVYMSRGTHQLLSCWIPYGEVPLEVGGLMVLEHSHLQSARLKNYLEVDVDLYCENRPREVEKVKGKGGWSHPGWLTNNPVSLREKLGGRWLTCEHYQPGDFLTFKMTTIHASLDNQTDRVRLSSDTRYQRASQPADARWVGANPAGHGPRAKQGMIC